MSYDWAVVAYVKATYKDVPADFGPNCKQFFFVPDFDDWAEYILKRYDFSEVAVKAVEFIRGNGNPAYQLAKWFNPCPVANASISGADDMIEPVLWENALLMLSHRVGSSYASLADVPESEFLVCFNSPVWEVTGIAREFFAFIHRAE